MKAGLTENDLEMTVLDWYKALGYAVLDGAVIAPGEPAAERGDYSETILSARLKNALRRINPGLPESAIEDAAMKLSRIDNPSLLQQNRVFHGYLTGGVPVEYKADNRIVHIGVKIIDFRNPANNYWLAVNQFTVVENRNNRRADVVVFLNGLPLAVIELKNPADENATVWSAFNQLQTYKQQIPSLFTCNEILVISDGMDARAGSLSSDRERFQPWRTVEGETLAPSSSLQLEVLIKGLFEKERFLSFVRHFVVFEEDSAGTLIKKLAAYHQFHAVNTAVEETVRASTISNEMTLHKTSLKGKDAKPGDRRIGVIWHTQGSGKSLTMAFYAGCLILNPAMENPTLVVLTDRNDLDDQLFGTFSRCHELLRQKPVQAGSRAHLLDLLKAAAGGVIFTTIQKFFPEEKGDSFPVLSERRNIVVIADEAHRSQYDFIDGYARHMRDALPNASFIGFTGTPIELTDKNTRAVFGDYISIYDIERAVQDGATVRIFYESRLAKLELKEEERPHIDTDFEEITEGEELEHKEKLKTKWAALEALVGAENRVKLIARDIVNHFEKRLETLIGKAMIVCMSRRICIELYNEIVALKPEWHDSDDKKGSIKIVMTGSASDPIEWQEHIRNKPRREELAKQFKDPENQLKIVLVRDMWLTGFDAPCLHTMYIDKPMRGHGLMQAIARVNRVWKDKPGGLIVDYLGLADALRKALADYTESGGHGDTVINQEEAVALMIEKFEVCSGLFHGFDYSQWKTGTPSEKLGLLPKAQEFILAQERGKERFLQTVSELNMAFALSVPHEKAIAIRDDVGFFQAIRSALAKTTPGSGKTEEDYDHAIKQLVSQAVSSDKVIDIFEAAGLKKPDLSILSEEFLSEVRGLKHKNLAVELLKKLLNNEIKQHFKKNIVQARSFLELLEKSIKAYQNRAIETVEVIEELIKLAKDINKAEQRGEELGLTDDEVAFYDALETNDSAVQVLGDETLKHIAQELAESIRKNASIDWNVRANVRAKLRVMVKRILRKYGYPPDKQEKATETVLEQAECLAIGLIV
ncbi:MAG: type I restriction endonuclease subunit R [Brevinematales bacterium]|nr:type I restriction endonuclease subunit R [Brevinematales bacterium]